MRERGIEVLEMHDLLARHWRSRGARLGARPQDQPQHGGRAGPGRGPRLAGRDAGQELAERLIGGIATTEIPVAPYTTLRQHIDPIRFVVPPLPNTLFTRDTTCWIYGGVSLNPMYWPARRQETLLTTAIYKFHHSSRTPSSSTGSAIPTSTTARRRSRVAT